MNRSEILDTKEEWRKVKGFDQSYEVSNFGRVKTLSHMIMRKNGRPQFIKERILKQSPDEWGYPQVALRGCTVKVHRLVALAFLGERVTGEVVRHLDGNPKNNHISNLSYGTPSENIMDCYSYRGKIHHRQKLTPLIAKEIRCHLSKGVPGFELAKQYDVSQQTICDIKYHRIYKEVSV